MSEYAYVYPERAHTYHEHAMQMVKAGEWEYNRACDHGSHLYCYPCSSPNWTQLDARTRCAGCGETLTDSFVTEDDDRWHIYCAPVHLLKAEDHYP